MVNLERVSFHDLLPQWWTTLPEGAAKNKGDIKGEHKSSHGEHPVAHLEIPPPPPLYS